MTPVAARMAVYAGRKACVSFYRPDSVKSVEEICASIMYDNGAFSEWMAALRRGEQWFIREDWSPYYRWLEPRLFVSDRWAVIPDAPGAPSQLNDALEKEWPFGVDRAAPLWHMDASISRLGRLMEKYSRVCFGWIGDGSPTQRRVNCDAYRKRMDEVAAFLGNIWPETHMMRGIAVASEYPFKTTDSTSLAQNGHRYDTPDDGWTGRNNYADRLERMASA